MSRHGNCAWCDKSISSDPKSAPSCLGRLLAYGQHQLQGPADGHWHERCCGQVRALESRLRDERGPPPSRPTTRNNPAGPEPPPPPPAQGGSSLAGQAAILAAEAATFGGSASGRRSSDPGPSLPGCFGSPAAPAAGGLRPGGGAAYASDFSGGASSSASGGGTPGDWSKWRAGDCVEICGTGTLLDGLTGMLETREGEITSVRSLCRVMLDGPPPSGYGDELGIVNVLAHQMRDRSSPTHRRSGARNCYEMLWSICSSLRSRGYGA